MAVGRFDDAELLHNITGADQEESEDENESDVLNGDYSQEKIQKEVLDVLMNADEDESELEDMDYPDIELGETIISECEGEDSEGNPKSVSSILSTKFDTKSGKMITVTRTAFHTPVLQIHYREEFIEFSYRYKSPVANELKLLFTALEKYGEELDSGSMDFIPSFSFVIVPISAFGTALVTADSPITWSISAEKPGGDVNTMKILFKAEDIHICGTDEMDLTQIDADAQKIIDQRDIAYEEMNEKEQARRMQSLEKDRAFMEMTKKK